MIRRSFRLLALATAFAALSTPVLAQAPADTLARIQQTHTITLGVRESAWPFSFVDAQNAGKPAGYSVDLCLAAVEEIKSTLKLKELDVKYRTVSASERIPKLESGEIDLECGSTTNTKARQDRVAFGPTMFVAGIRVLVPKGTKAETVQDLAGMTVAVSKGSTSEKLLTQLTVSEVKATVKVFENNDEAFKALRAGTVKAFAQDDSLLLGLVARNKAQDALVLGNFALSVEPYAIMMRKNDTALMGVVDKALGKLYASREIDQFYKKWFATGQITIPVGRLTRESFSRPNKEAGVAMMLGYSL
ncbi:amino acid ABC transporter substrate-binding protein [Paracidovorax konjaci]|uniref:Amino acid ABC transporter substrate-binding protein, PAAT family n=1 Tax=Paracidovorax konjaci TaxID=32040 RepID=A0A1I1VJ35_9BURK|nr:amino acid ABC transporter substrate-binding protein [Paracidovorax konjaci]SFD82048.1 amino acid ABC transporter substrate-binding protein, PAAT family [Paracidovorax konjaci]